MRNGLIAAILASGCLIGFQAAALAQDLNEHPGIATPDQALQHPNAASQSKDRQMAPSNSEDVTGRPAPGPHESH